MRSPVIDADFPGGNIKVVKQEDNVIYLEQDNRDSESGWFYWCFRIKCYEDRKLTFKFPFGKMAVYGPAVSVDNRENWHWLFSEPEKRDQFEYDFEAGQVVYFSMAMPYTYDNFQKFIKSNPVLKPETFCLSNKGAKVPYLVTGNSEAGINLLLTARHHCCEMMASYELEGILEELLYSENQLVRELFEKVKITAIPFVDYDGVEAGDQGKNRTPHDHNRDYCEEPLYNEVKAIMAYCRNIPTAETLITLDLHCPYLYDQNNEHVYIVGSEDPENWQQQQLFSKCIEKVAAGLEYSHDGILPYGVSWNTAANKSTTSCGNWMRQLPNCRMSTTIELPYAIAGNSVVTAESAREFGRSVAVALADYILNR